MTAPEDTTLDLGIPELDENAFERFVDLEPVDGARARVFDVPESISAMGYGSHQFFRYYGKFPSLVGREIISNFAVPGLPVLDIFSGSGTTQVEAQIAGFRSYGLDINPLSVLASNAKTGYYDERALRLAFTEVLGKADQISTAFAALAGVADPDLKLSAKQPFLDKWFTTEVQHGLAALRSGLLALPDSDERDFLTTCFLAIVRRCSNAFDGEVRPHINREKLPKAPRRAFVRKFEEMIDGFRELDGMRPANVSSLTLIGDNRDAKSYEALGADRAGLIVSHPPYLNSFNYLAVFSLEFAWSDGFENVWRGWNRKQINALEQRAHPATNAQLLAAYYEGLHEAHARAIERLAPGGTLAVVVGDATIHGKLEPVHRIVWDDLREQGLVPTEFWYRTTHYGIGKYAYSGRADYHGEAEKKDAIMFLRRPME